MDQTQNQGDVNFGWNNINLFDIFGVLETVSVAPAGTPVSFSIFDQIKIYVNGATYRLYWYDAANNIWHFNTSANGVIATSATSGHGLLPTCAGTPTGVPAAGNGSTVYDTTNNKLYVYNGAWKGVTLS